MNPSTGLDLYALATLEYNEVFDADGRPLIELRDDTVERKRCPYPGRRYGRMMNLSALKQMGSHWQELLDALAYVTSVYMQREEREQTELRDWFGISSVAVALPSYLLSRPRDPVQNRQLPGFVASLTKAAFDVTTTTKLMLARSFAGEPAPADLQQTAVVAEDASLFLDGEDGACAGSPKHVETFLSMLAVPTARTRDLSAMHAIVPDPAEMLAYCDAVTAIDTLLLLLRGEATTAVQLIRAALPPVGFTDEIAVLSEGLARTAAVPRLAGLVSDLMQDGEAHRRILLGFSNGHVVRHPSPGMVAAYEQLRGLAKQAHASERLHELTARSPCGAQIASSTLAAIAEAIVSYLCLERAIVVCFEPIQAAANQALRKPDGRKPTEADVLKLVRTPAAVLSMLTDIRIVNGAEGTKVSLGADTLEF